VLCQGESGEFFSRLRIIVWQNQWGDTERGKREKGVEGEMRTTRRRSARVCGVGETGRGNERARVRYGALDHHRSFSNDLNRGMEERELVPLYGIVHNTSVPGRGSEGERVKVWSVREYNWNLVNGTLIRRFSYSFSVTCAMPPGSGESESPSHSSRLLSATLLGGSLLFQAKSISSVAVSRSRFALRDRLVRQRPSRAQFAWVLTSAHRFHRPFVRFCRWRRRGW